MALVKWTTPKVVRRYEWQTGGKPQLLRLAWYATKWTLLLGLPTLYAVWQFAPFALHKVAVGVLCLPFLMMLQIALPFASSILAGRECRLDNKGLFYKVGNDNRRICWHQMQSWTISDHPKLPGIRILTIKATRLRRLRTFTFPFNPRTTDEARLRGLLREHVRAQ